MILRAAKEHSIDLACSLLSAISARMVEAGKAAGVGRLFHVSTATEMEPLSGCVGQLAPGSGGQALSIWLRVMKKSRCAAPVCIDQ